MVWSGPSSCGQCLAVFGGDTYERNRPRVVQNLQKKKDQSAKAKAQKKRKAQEDQQHATASSSGQPAAPSVDPSVEATSSGAAFLGPEPSAPSTARTDAHPVLESGSLWFRAAKESLAWPVAPVLQNTWHMNWIKAACERNTRRPAAEQLPGTEVDRKEFNPLPLTPHGLCKIGISQKLCSMVNINILNDELAMRRMKMLKERGLLPKEPRVIPPRRL
eukprot:s977_g7.t1